MLDITEYTSTDEVRAVLGVSDEELDDITIKLSIYAYDLGFQLSDISETLEASYTELKALPTRSVEQQRLLDVVQVFSAYAISKTLLTSASLFAPKRITDGKAEVERFNDPFSDLRADVLAAYAAIRARLIRALEGVGVIVTPATNRSYFTTAGLAVNPITGI